MRSENPAPEKPLSRRRVGLLVAAAVLLLALAETVSAVVSPLRAPREGDWASASKRVRAGFRPGDLIVASPAWADPVMRVHLGDLIPVSVAGRIDDGRFPRVWELSQRGARAPEADGGRLASRTEHGNLELRLWEKPGALPVTYDFQEHWTAARVSRQPRSGPAVPCPPRDDRHQCPDDPNNFVRPWVVEVGGTLRNGFWAPPVDHGTVVIEYPDVPLGRELAVGAGLHHVWYRKHREASVRLRVLVGGQQVADIVSGNRTGWRVVRADTSSWRGKRANVRFEITTEAAFSRQLGFAAEARGP